MNTLEQLIKAGEDYKQYALFAQQMGNDEILNLGQEQVSHACWAWLEEHDTPPSAGGVEMNLKCEECSTPEIIHRESPLELEATHRKDKKSDKRKRNADKVDLRGLKGMAFARFSDIMKAFAISGNRASEFKKVAKNEKTIKVLNFATLLGLRSFCRFSVVDCCRYLGVNVERGVIDHRKITKNLMNQTELAHVFGVGVMAIASVRANFGINPQATRVKGAGVGVKQLWRVGDFCDKLDINVNTINES